MLKTPKLSHKRNSTGFSLIETMTVISVIAIVVGLLYAYSDQGWKLFYQSYGRGLSQIKAKLAIRTLTEELRESNKARITVGQGITYGIPQPDDIKDNSPFIYFTKPKFFEETGDVIGYDYILYYFARPKENDQNERNRFRDDGRFLILKNIKFLNQSKIYTEDYEKTWPFLPPIIEINKSTLPEDDSNLEVLKSSSPNQEETQETSKNTEEEFLDHFAKLKQVRRIIPVSGNFKATSLTEPFSKEQVNIFFGQEYTSDNPIKIKVSLQESPFLFGLMGAITEFEVSITPRN